MVKFGNWIFHYRNFLFPAFYLFLFIPSPEIFTNYNTAILAGLIISLIGEGIRMIVMGLVNIQHGGKDRTIHSSSLITTGIFSHSRNPLYIGNILILSGLGVAANSVIFMIVMIPIFIFLYQAIVLAEEDYLQKTFGVAYAEYRANVNRWIPDFSGLKKTMGSMRFSVQRMLIKEYNSAYLWMTGMVLLVMKAYWQHHDKITLQRAVPVFLGILLLLLVCYLLIRYMKKSRHWTAE